MGITLHQTGVCIQNRDILRDVSIFFSPGLHLLVGLNGSGKSTLLRMVAGFLPYSGSVLVGETEISSLSARSRARAIAWVPQSLALPFDLSVRDLVVMGRFPYLDWLGRYSHEDYRLADQALRQFGITDLSGRSIQEISGGERQKAILSRAWCQQADIWLLDEPDQALDPKSKAELWQAMVSLSLAGKVVLCATHETAWMHEKAATSVIGLRQGQVYWQGKPEELQAKEVVEIYGPWPSGLSFPGWS